MISGDATRPDVRMPETLALRSSALTFADNPFLAPGESAVRYESDALLVMRGGRIVALGPAAALLPGLPPDVPVTRYERCVLLPGFIDAHVHYAQLPAIAAFGRTLLDWLQEHTFVVEQAFGDPAFAGVTAEVFLDECLRQGITTSMVYGTVHAASVDAFCTAASARNLRMIAGKVMMDRQRAGGTARHPAIGLRRRQGADRALARPRPPRLRRDAAFRAHLLARAAGGGRRAAGRARGRVPPDAPRGDEGRARLGRRALPGARPIISRSTSASGWSAGAASSAMACILARTLWRAAGTRQAQPSPIARRPTTSSAAVSFRIGRAADPGRPVRVALATDVGGGTTLSMFATMNEAYKVARHTGFALTAVQALWLATAGAADALSLGGVVGGLDAGHEADVIVVDLAPTPLIAYRMQFCDGIEDALAVLMMLGDDRAIRATYVAGRLAHAR